MAEQMPNVTPEEVELCYTIEAPHVNRIIASMRGPNVRLTFLERQLPESPNYPRAAVTMLVPDAMEMRDLLNRLLENVEVFELPKDSEEQG